MVIPDARSSERLSPQEAVVRRSGAGVLDGIFRLAMVQRLLGGAIADHGHKPPRYWNLDGSEGPLVGVPRSGTHDRPTEHPVDVEKALPQLDVIRVDAAPEPGIRDLDCLAILQTFTRSDGASRPEGWTATPGRYSNSSP